MNIEKDGRLKSCLKSLKHQGFIGKTHIWNVLNGYQNCLLFYPLLCCGLISWGWRCKEHTRKHSIALPKLFSAMDCKTFNILFPSQFSGPSLSWKNGWIWLLISSFKKVTGSMHKSSLRACKTWVINVIEIL